MFDASTQNNLLRVISKIHRASLKAEEAYENNEEEYDLLISRIMRPLREAVAHVRFRH